LIEGVFQVPLEQFQDERGKVMRMLRVDDVHFRQFGEIYFSWIYAGVIKAWHKHMVMDVHYCVPLGCVKVVLYDDRKESITNGQIDKYFLNAERYSLLKVPCGLWYGFKAIGGREAMVANCSTIPYDSQEIIRVPYTESKIPYTWNIDING
jgi:dTDP-4-dehydrorhamnose 3,5-epimerase